jgi:outer membrane protein assembly factor BamB
MLEPRQPGAGHLAVIFCALVALAAAGCTEAGPDTGGTGPAEASAPDWPMFRGRPDLAGVAQGSLPNRLVLRWKFKAEDSIKSSAAVQDGRVFVGSNDGNVYALDLADGHKLWAYKTGDAVEASPLVLQGAVYIGSSDAFLYALDAATGALKWKYETESKILGGANWVRSPDGQDTWILVGSYDYRLYCIDSKTGQAVWTCATGNYVNGTPAVAGGRIIFGSCDGQVRVVHVATGKEEGSIDAGAYIAGSVAVADGRAYTGNMDWKCLALDLASRRTVWSYSVDAGDFEGEPGFYSSPAVGPRQVVIGCRDKNLYAFDRSSGRRLWTFAARRQIDSSPVIVGDKVVVGSDGGRVCMVRLASGKPVWSFDIGKPVTASPAVAAGMVVIGADDGYLYAFGSKP